MIWFFMKNHYIEILNKIHIHDFYFNTIPMKTILLFMLIVTSLCTISAQMNEIQEFNNLLLRTQSASRSLEYEDIQGHPYSNKELIPGTIAFVSGNHIDSLPLRYNWYSHEMEFEHQGNILSMPVTQNIDYITIYGSKYVPFNYLKNINGYMIELYKGQYSLFRREDVRFVEAKPPQSGYDEYQPATFQWYRTQYIVFTGTGEIIELEMNKKKLPLQFPGYESKIENYVEDTKLNIKQEEDLIRLIEMINSIQ